MATLKDFVTTQAAFNARINAAIDGVVSDIKALDDKIDAFQSSPGTLSPEDQAMLDGLQAQSQALAEKAEALDALTPPVPPAA